MAGGGRANEIPLLRIPQVRFGDCEASEAPESVEQRWAEEERKRFALGAAPSMGRWCRHPWCQAQVKVEDQLGPTPRKTTRRPGEVHWEMTDFSVTTQSTPQSTPGVPFKPQSGVENRRQVILQVHVPGNLVPSEDAYQSAIQGQRILEDGARKNCRNPADDTPGNPDAKLHLPVKSEKNAHTAARFSAASPLEGRGSSVNAKAFMHSRHGHQNCSFFGHHGETFEEILGSCQPRGPGPLQKAMFLRAAACLGVGCRWSLSTLTARPCARSYSAGSGSIVEAESLAKGKSLHAFEVSVRQSQIAPDCGKGVFVSASDAPVGALVALYAGVWFPNVPRAHFLDDDICSWVTVMDLHGPEAVDPELAGCEVADVVAYRLFCDGGILDGFQAERRVRRAGLQSPFAVGQLVNHPPQGIEANVQILEISEPLDETWAVSRLHQGLWYLDRTWSPVNVPQGRAHGAMRAPTVAMEALRELRVGEELFLDYKLRPPHPPWYTPR
ncbi:unnamed protein product [Cladocopium goreaui]|uniref:SET domain-containing protein n=1 Tax=Cladocopium goreaui TaxID=2562237 RepID=A0A9P1CDT2_9DINO|nr:unnamed protein product [Cladocopium goreaui]